MTVEKASRASSTRSTPHAWSPEAANLAAQPSLMDINPLQLQGAPPSEQVVQEQAGDRGPLWSEQHGVGAAAEEREARK